MVKISTMVAFTLGVILLAGSGWAVERAIKCEGPGCEHVMNSFQPRPGDTFEAFGRIFLLKSVEEVFLMTVANMWKEEGCRSREHFIEVRESIHPKAGFDLEQIVWLHEFELVGKPV